MNILTPDGYKPIEEIQIGDKVVAFDVFTGEKIENEVLEKHLWNHEVPEFTGKFYRINGQYELFEEQSIWRNNNVVFHAKNLKVGDIIFDENDQDVVITSIEETINNHWWKLHISGDASFISEGLTLHNASRFWVGGTNTWDNVTITNWSGTTGGGGGSSVPGSADLANFDSGTGGTGTITLNYSPTIGGITGGTHTGTLDVTGQTVTFSSSTKLNYSGTGTRTLNITNATLNIVGGASGGWDITTSTNMTLIATGSSIINTAAQNSSFQGGGLTYGNVSLTVGGGGCTLGGANTFNNLSLICSSTGRVAFTLNLTNTVNGVFSATGSSATSFGMIVPSGTGSNNYAGATYTINAASVTLTNIILVGLIGTGAGSWVGTNVGDGGSCTGITFTAPVNRHWVATSGGNYASTTSWSATSGGASGASIPLPQDTVFFNANSITSGSRTITLNHCAFPTLDFSALLNSPIINFTLTNGGTYFFGDLTMGANVTSSGTNGVLAMGVNTQNINLQGHTFGSSASTVLGIQGTNVVLTGDWTSGGIISLVSGTFNTNGYLLTSTTFSNTTQNITRALNLGASVWTLTGTGTVWSSASVTGFTLTAGTSTIVINNTSATSKTFAGGGKTYNNMVFSGDNIIITGSNSFGNLSFSNPGLTNGTKFTSATTTTIGGISSTGSAGSLCKISSVTPGSAFTIASSSPQVVAQYVSLQDSTASPINTFYAINSTNVSNNTNWNFINPRNRNTAIRTKVTTSRLRVTTDRLDATSRQHASITL